MKLYFIPPEPAHAPQARPLTLREVLRLRDGLQPARDPRPAGTASGHGAAPWARPFSLN